MRKDLARPGAEGRAWPYACFLACSWTWCIGMFLPVLLVRDFGLMGFACFAVPNVLGAAAMGWVLRGGAGANLVRMHGGACRAFSLVTIAFQLYFAAWFGRAIAGEAWPLFVGVGIVTWAALVGLGALRGGIALWVASCAAFVFLLARGAVQALMNFPGALGASEALYLAPICAFGFGLCPYLDLTFHAAAVGAGARRRAAFTLGFGVLFSVMIAFTLWYAGLFEIDAHGLGSRSAPTRWVLGIVLAHIAAQLAYTIAVHSEMLRGGRVNGATGAERGPSRGAGVLVFAAVLAVAVGFAAQGLPGYAGLSFGEIVYRCFMAFYGLVFPAYVWICVIPGRGGAGLTRQKVRAWALAVGIAAPMFWMGFIERQTWWLGPGLLIVLMARLALPRVAGVRAWPAPRAA